MEKEISTTIHEFITPWGKTIKAYARENTIDWNTLQSCIVEDEYRLSKLPITGLAVDLGAYIGGVTLALISKGWYVYAVEPLPENSELLQKNLALNGFEKSCTIIQKAIGRDILYYDDPATEFGRLHYYNGSGQGVNGRQVTKTTLKEILGNKRCNFLKIDIEGAEWDIDFTDKIDRIAVEIEGHPATTEAFGKLLPNFIDVSKEYFPEWSSPGEWVHGYYKNKTDYEYN